VQKALGKYSEARATVVVNALRYVYESHMGTASARVTIDEYNSPRNARKTTVFE
jgi:hypothetical protein